MVRAKKETVVLVYRQKEDAYVVGAFEDEEAAWEGAVEHLEEMNVDKEELEDLGLTLREAVERWSELTDGYEDFTLERARVRRGRRS